MKRVYVYNNKSECDGKVIAIDESSKFLQNVSSTLNITAENIKLYASNGCEITDTRVLRDEEKVYLSAESNITSRNCDKYDDKRSKSCAVSDWITLNVGGKHFLTTRSTLLGKEPQSMLGRMFAEENNQMNPSAIDATGAYLIDRSPEYFEPILNYLRHGEVILDKHVNPRGVYEEAVFYGIESMIPILNDLMVLSRTGPHSNNQVLTRLDVIKLIFSTPTTSKLRFQGVNLTGADLTKLDLSNINFKYANMARCNLSGANLSHCCLERADLSQANLEGAQLIGVKASCANMEGANLKGCNMEDPAGLKACLDGVNLKGANLEGSNMAGVNLRVATLKNANLQNCDLRTAVFAGADLESCDLSGSDLHEANLRGANLRDAAFELMLTPLHMSQTVR